MATVDQVAPGPPVGRSVVRGFAAAHGVLIGALYLALLYVPLQVTSAFYYSAQAALMVSPGAAPDPEHIFLALALAGANMLLGLAVFFAFPFLLGGMLGQVRDRLVSPGQPPGPFTRYGREHYGGLLASEGLFLLSMLAVFVPVACLIAGLVSLELNSLAGLPKPGEFNWSFVENHGILAVMVVAMLALSAGGMVYWVANCIVVAERTGAATAWRRALAFCRKNFAAVLAVWLINLVAGVVTAPLGLLGQLGIVRGWPALVALAVLNSAVIGYWAVANSGLFMSVYLDRRHPPGSSEGLAAAGR
jgi:hypothetical protein